jgi:hypothetical protein
MTTTSPEPRKLPKLPPTAIIGIIFLYIAGFGWAADIIIPFLDIPHKVIAFTIALAIAELSFLIGVALLGKTYYKKLKAILLNFIRTGKINPPG